MQFDKEKLAEDVLMYRALHNITQEQLAEKCNISREYIVAVEKGTANLRRTTYLRIKEAIKEV